MIINKTLKINASPSFTDIPNLYIICKQCILNVGKKPNLELKTKPFLLIYDGFVVTRLRTR